MDSKRRRHWLLRLAITAGLFLLVLLGLSKLINLDRYRDTLENAAGKSLGITLKLGPLRWGAGVGSGIWLEAESLVATGGPLQHSQLQTATIYVNIAVTPLLTRRQLVIEEIVVSQPELTLLLEDIQEQLPAVDAGQTTAAQDPLLSYHVAKLRIHDGVLHLRDKRTSAKPVPNIDFKDINLAVHQPGPGARTSFELTAINTAPSTSEERGKVQATGSLLGLGADFSLNQPQLQVSATLTAVSLEALKPWFADPVVAGRLAGNLGANVTYQGWPGTASTAHGELDLGQLAYTDTALWPSPMPGAPTVLAFSAQLDNRDLVLSRLNLRLGDVSIEGQTTIRQWQEQATASGTSFSATVPVTAIQPLVPWNAVSEDADRIRELLAGGGQIAIEEVKLPDIALAGKTAELAEVFNAVTADVKLSRLSLPLAANLPPLEHVGGHLQLAGGKLRGSNIEAKLGPLSLPGLSFTATELLTRPKAQLLASGPMQLAAVDNRQMQALLAPYGLASFSGEADVELKLAYDTDKPQQWTTEGSVALHNVELSSIDKANTLLVQGKLELQRDTQIDVVLTGVKGHLNDSPLAIDGAVMDLGGKQMLLDITARTSALQLGPLADFVPALKRLAVAGAVDADVSVHFQQQFPKKTRLKGSVEVKDMALDMGDYRVAEGMAQLQLTGKQVNIKRANLLLNKQPVQLVGKLAYERQLRGKLALTSSPLDLDKLLANRRSAAKTKAAIPSPTADEPPPEQLPPLIRNAVLELDGKVARGTYRGQTFQNLHLWLDYNQGVVRDHSFSLDIAEGSVASSGNLDLKNLASIPFAIEHKIANIRLEDLLPLIVGQATNASGPISSSGTIRGTTGDGLLESLRGDVAVTAGPGRMANVGPLTKALFSVLEVISVEGIIKGTMGEGLAEKGIRFESLALAMKLEPQGVLINGASLRTPAFDAQAQGLVSLVDQTLDMEVELMVFGTLDKVVGLVPLVGSAASNITKVFLAVKGPVEKPTVRVRPAQGVIKTVEGSFKDPVKQLGKGLESLRGILNGKDKKPD